MNRQFIATGIFYCASYLLGSVVFILLFHTPLFRDGVLFYRGLVLLGITSMIMAAGGMIYRLSVGKQSITRKDVVFIVIITLCLNLVFFTHLPVTADRSLTIYLLKKMSTHPAELYTKEALRDELLTEYILNKDATQRRLNEQVLSGTIQQVNNGFVITPRGVYLIKMYDCIARMFGISIAIGE